MNEPSPIEQAEALLRKLESSDKDSFAWTLPIVFVLLLILCLVLSIMREPYLHPAKETPDSLSTVPETAPRLLPLSETANYPDAYVLIQAGLGGYDDLFYCSKVVTRTCDNNVSLSPALGEVWPVLHAASERITYYGIGDHNAEVFVSDLPDGPPQPLTMRAGGSGLHTEYEITPTLAPSFSPDGHWVAFTARSLQGNYLEVFLARDDGRQVMHVTDEVQLYDYQVRDYVWLDAEMLLIAVQRPDGTLKQWQVTVGVKSLDIETLTSAK